MYSLMRSIGILLIMMGIGSFVLPRFNRDSWVWQSLGSARNPTMTVSIVLGAILFSLSYKLQMDKEKEEAARRRAARELPTRRRRTTAEPAEQVDTPTNDFASANVETGATAHEVAPAASPLGDWKFPDASLPGANSSEDAPIEAGSVIVAAKSLQTPQVVAEYTPVAEEKAGSESVVIEKTAADIANRPLEKSPSSILQPVSEKRLRSSPAFEEDPESIFDELPQNPPQALT